MHSKKAKHVIKKEVVHTMLSRPIYLRKQVLKAAIDSTKALKDYGELKIIREEKKRVLGILAEKLDEVKRRIDRLVSRDLPKLPLEHNKTSRVESEVISEQLKVEHVHKGRVKEDSDVAKLKAELEDIERKLKNL